MKKTVKIATFLALVSILFTACTNGGNEAVTTDTEAETTAESKICVFESGKCDYKIVRADSLGSGVTAASVELRRVLQEKSGTELEIITDFELPNYDTAKRSPYEILVGLTNREESTEAQNGLGYNDFSVSVRGTRICVNGGCEEALVNGIVYLQNMISADDKLLLNADFVYTQRGEYKLADAKINGIPLSEFTLVCGSSYRSLASNLAARIGKLTGIILEVVSDSNEKTAHEIVIGSNKRYSAKTFAAQDDFDIEFIDGSVRIQGYAKEALGEACDLLYRKLVAGQTENLETVNYTLPDREVYINDIYALGMRWAYTFTPEDWLLDFDEKYAAMLDPDGRMMTNTHRGDSIYYPENSIEAYISAIRMGADMLEIDPRLTKDGVFVLMHDATLTRTTDFSEKAGKNGLPTSVYLCDWTYEQLMQLNLKEGNGGTNAKVTSFKIPTLDEAMKVAANRIFIRLDVKGPDSGGIFWDFEKDIWPLEQKYSTYSNVIFTWHSMYSAGGYAIPKKYKALQKTASGKCAPLFTGCSQNTTASEVLKTIKNYKSDYIIKMTDTDWNTESLDAFLKRNEEKLSGLKGKVRIYIDAVTSGTNMQETPEYWNKCYKAGISFMLTNASVEFVRYVQNNFSATEIQK